MQISSPEIRQLRRLQDENADLRIRVKKLEQAMRGDAEMHFPASWGLKPQEAALLNRLMSRDFCNRDSTADVLFGHTSYPAEQLNVVLCRVRKKVSRFGVIIETIRSRGHSISAEHRRVLKSAIEAGR